MFTNMVFPIKINTTNTSIAKICNSAETRDYDFPYFFHKFLLILFQHLGTFSIFYLIIVVFILDFETFFFTTLGKPLTNMFIGFDRA